MMGPMRDVPSLEWVQAAADELDRVVGFDEACEAFDRAFDSGGFEVGDMGDPVKREELFREMVEQLGDGE